MISTRVISFHSLIDQLGKSSLKSWSTVVNVIDPSSIGQKVHFLQTTYQEIMKAGDRKDID